MPVLTAISVAGFKPYTTRREIPDTRAPGLYLVVQLTGSKSWIVRLRRPNGKSAKLTLGHVNLVDKETTGQPVPGGTLTLRQARTLAVQIDNERASGKDVVRVHREYKLRMPTTFGEMKSREQQIAEKWNAFASSGTVASCFLYRHYDSDGDLLYIGITNDIMARSARHFRRASWAAAIFKILVEPFESREALVSAEVVAVKTEYPQHNRTWNGDRANPLAAVAEGAWKD